MAIPSRRARARPGSACGPRGTNRRPPGAEVVVLGHRRSDKGDGRGLSHRREVAVGRGAVVVVGDGLRGGDHELDGSADARRQAGHRPGDHVAAARAAADVAGAEKVVGRA